MSLHLTLRVANDCYTWTIWNDTSTRKRDEPNLYTAKRDDEHGGWTAVVRAISHTPTDGAGPLIAEVMRLLPPPNPDVPKPAGWVMLKPRPYAGPPEYAPTPDVVREIEKRVVGE